MSWQTRMLAASLTASFVVAGCDAFPWNDEREPDHGGTPSSACISGEELEVPDDLACTGLYADFGAKMVAPTVRPFAPAVSFWSDGYDKERFIELPEGTTIDASRVDDWRFPTGTKVWKEIRTSSGRKIETRFFWKASEDRWLQAAYVWSEDGARATRGEGSEVFVDGKPYRIPTANDCNDCHRGRRDKLLGVEALSLALEGATGITLAQLVAEGRVVPSPVQTSMTLPDPALAVLHVNCGVTCHNGTTSATAYSTGLRLRLTIDEVTTKPPSTWEALVSSIDVPATSPGWAGEVRVKPGSPEESLIVQVMRHRGAGQMPPLATTVVDSQSVALVEAWVRALPRATEEPPDDEEKEEEVEEEQEEEKP